MGLAVFALVMYLFSLLRNINDSIRDNTKEIRRQGHSGYNLRNVKLYEMSQAEEEQRHQELLDELKKSGKRKRKITRNIARDSSGNIVAQEIIEE